MIKAKINNNVILGIDAENVKRLKQGKPILVKGEEVGSKENILIVYGNTLSDIQKELSLPSVQ